MTDDPELPGGTTAVKLDDSALVERTAAVKKLRRKEAWRRRLPLLPALIFVIVVTQIPFALGIYYSLTNWVVNPPGPREFVGIENYVGIFGDRFFREAVVVTVLMTGGAVIGSVLLGLGMAVLLDRKFVGVGFIRTLVLTPFLIMPVVAGLVWKTQMLGATFGVINWFTGLFGIGQIEFVGKYPLWSITTVLIWQWTPFMMLILLAGLQSQPESSLEAARVDGAGAWATFTQITLPHLRSYIELGVLLGSIYIIQVFDHIQVITKGTPDSTNVPYYVYRASIGGGWRFGEASAYSVVVVIATIILALGGLRVLSGLLEGEEPA